MRKIDPESFFVYSTDPDAMNDEDDVEQEESIPASEQRLFVRKEKKGRGGKVVTIIEGFEGPDNELDELAKDIKKHVGTGGSVKEGEIIIQGDRADQIVQFLQNRGFYAKKTTM